MKDGHHAILIRTDSVSSFELPPPDKSVEVDSFFSEKFGVDDAKPQIMSRDAIRLGLREETFDERDNGWVPFEIPKEVLLSAWTSPCQRSKSKLPAQGSSHVTVLVYVLSYQL